MGAGATKKVNRQNGSKLHEGRLFYHTKATVDLREKVTTPTSYLYRY